MKAAMAFDDPTMDDDLRTALAAQDCLGRRAASRRMRQPCETLPAAIAGHNLPADLADLPVSQHPGIPTDERHRHQAGRAARQSHVPATSTARPGRPQQTRACGPTSRGLWPGSRDPRQVGQGLPGKVFLARSSRRPLETHAARPRHRSSGSSTAGPSARRSLASPDRSTPACHRPRHAQTCPATTLR